MNLAKRVEDLEAVASVYTGDSHTVVGFVCPEKGFTHALTNQGGDWSLTHAEPDVYLAAKLELILRSRKRFVILIGGRGSTKSVGGSDICLIDAKDTGAKTYFLREYQSSIKSSVHSLLKEEIKRLEFEGFDVQQNSIRYNGDDVCMFAGLAKNVDSIKSAHGFRRFQVEEAQFITEESLKTLTPTARKKPKKGLPSKLEEVEDDPLKNVSLMFIANPGSTEDPFSQRFINPFLTHLERDGFYSDDLHDIIVMNYDDNPWFYDSGLEQERAYDEEHLPPALYDHIWLGKFNDSIDNGLITREIFDSCIDAHKVKGFGALGIKMAAHDPSDTGGDTKGMAIRHGSVVTFVDEKPSGDVNEGGDWAAVIAKAHGVDTFTWDCDGMGVALNRQFATAFHDTKIALAMFKGSEAPDLPDAIYNPTALSNIQNQKTWREVCRNKRAQYYLQLRDRMYKTHRYVKYGEHSDIEELISFDSSIECLDRLRSELCRLPVKPSTNGYFELYTKEVMKSKFGLASPNLGDSVMMVMRYVAPQQPQSVYRMPKPLPTMGRR